MHFYKNIAHYH